MISDAYTLTTALAEIRRLKAPSAVWEERIGAAVAARDAALAEVKALREALKPALECHSRYGHITPAKLQLLRDVLAALDARDKP
jgi:hypothetical protein